MRQLFVFVLILGLSLPLLAQQTGDANRDYLINGSGAGATSPAPATVSLPGSFSQTYNTLDAGSPVIWATANAISLGAFNTATNSLDLDLLSLSFLGIGGAPGSFVNNFFFTDANGVWSATNIVPGTLNGTAIPFQMAHLAASSPDGFWLSQAHQVSFQNPCTFPATNINAGDDTSTNMPLGFPYSFYGTAYTDLFIGSNGYITFGAGDTSFIESVSSFLSGAPRISLYWDDLTPGGTPNSQVAFFTDNASIAEVCFVNVPEFFSFGANSFDAILDSDASTVTVTYGGMTSQDGLVGMSPGNNLDPVGTAISLTGGIANPNVLTAGSAAYELFTSAAPNNLSGNTITWFLDGTGNPLAQQ